MSARALTILKLSLLLAPLAVLPAMISCNGGGGGGGSSNPIVSALIGCGLLTPGQTPMFDSTDPFDNCMSQCMAGGTCAELEDLVCIGAGLGEALFSSCYAQCIQSNGVACDGTMMPPDIKCDGFPDCQDGSDEVGCPGPYMCSDGTEIPPDYQCDGFPDCEDMGDEQNCPSFTCGTGETVPLTWKCDLEEDCEDGSDEVGCAMLTCPDDGMSMGMTTTPDPDTTTTGGTTGGTTG